MLIKVRDKKTGIIRTVTRSAYAALGPKVYEKLGTVNDDGTEIGVSQSPNQNTPLAQRSVRAAAPVVVSSKLVAPTPVNQPVETEEPEEPVQQNPEPEPKQPAPVEVKRKPGRQPGSKNKSISSNSTTDEK